jgi:hypothetical protein
VTEYADDARLGKQIQAAFCELTDGFLDIYDNAWDGARHG